MRERTLISENELKERDEESKEVEKRNRD